MRPERVKRFVVHDEATGAPIGEIVLRQNAYEQDHQLGRVSLQDTVPGWTVNDELDPARVRVKR